MNHNISISYNRKYPQQLYYNTDSLIPLVLILDVVNFPPNSINPNPRSTIRRVEWESKSLDITGKLHCNTDL